MRTQRLIFTVGALCALVLVTAACQPVKGSGPSAPDGPPPPGSPTLAKTDLVTGLTNPWDLGFVPGGNATDHIFFFTERPGTVKKVTVTAGAAAAPVQIYAAPDVALGGESGMLGLAVDPEFNTPTSAGFHSLYVCYTSIVDTKPSPDLKDVRVVKLVLDPTLTIPVPTVLNIPIPYNNTWNSHSGCRLRFKPGTDELWITTGDAFVGTHAQDLSVLAGKVLRVTRTGAPYPGNPFGTAVYTFGHRNPQGIAFRPGDNQPYSTEHGSNRDDEVNELVAGGNGGWDPIPGYNQDSPMTDLAKFPNAMIPAWRSGDAGPFPASATIAPSGATFLEGPEWGPWNGALAVACLKTMHLRIMFLDGNGNVFYTTQVLKLNTRLRVAVEGPDNNLYITTDPPGAGDGAIWKVTPTLPP